METDRNNIRALLNQPPDGTTERIPTVSMWRDMASHSDNDFTNAMRYSWRSKFPCCRYKRQCVLASNLSHLKMWRAFHILHGRKGFCFYMPCFLVFPGTGSDVPRQWLSALTTFFSVSLTTSIGARSFSVNGPVTWNDLPLERVLMESSVGSFAKNNKTNLKSTSLQFI